MSTTKEQGVTQLEQEQLALRAQVTARSGLAEAVRQATILPQHKFGKTLRVSSR